MNNSVCIHQASALSCHMQMLLARAAPLLPFSQRSHSGSQSAALLPDTVCSRHPCLVDFSGLRLWFPICPAIPEPSWLPLPPFTDFSALTCGFLPGCPLNHSAPPVQP